MAKNELQAQLEAMQAKLEAAEKRAADAEKAAAEAKARKTGTGGVSMVVAAKGGISIYGLQTRPVTLYAGQWHRLFPKVEDLRALIVSERDALAWKSTEDKTTVLRSLGYDGPITPVVGSSASAMVADTEATA